MKFGFPALTLTLSVLAISGCNKALTEDSSPLPKWSIPGFSTDFSRIGIDTSAIISGGPGKDGIPAIDSPEYESIESTGSRIADREPVILVKINGEARIYPVQILTWHEIVNDVLGENPIAVTFCPLCNTGIVFHRQFDDSILYFGTTGHLSKSNLIMYDRQTESWWQQASGEAIVGDYIGRKLEFLPSLTLSFEDAIKAVPDADVLAPPTSVRRSYGVNPYEAYDSPGSRPFLFQGSIDTENPMERVLLIVHKDETRNIPYTEAQS